MALEDECLKDSHTTGRGDEVSLILLSNGRARRLTPRKVRERRS